MCPEVFGYLVAVPRQMVGYERPLFQGPPRVRPDRRRQYFLLHGSNPVLYMPYLTSAHRWCCLRITVPDDVSCACRHHVAQHRCCVCPLCLEYLMQVHLARGTRYVESYNILCASRLELEHRLRRIRRQKQNEEQLLLDSSTTMNVGYINRTNSLQDRRRSRSYREG